MLSREQISVVTTPFGEMWEEVGVEMTNESEPSFAVFLTKQIAYKGDGDQLGRGGLTIVNIGKLEASQCAQLLKMVVHEDVDLREEVGQAKMFQKLAGSHNPSFSFFARFRAAPEVISGNGPISGVVPDMGDLDGIRMKVRGREERQRVHCRE